jgi:hypothetical protein
LLFAAADPGTLSTRAIAATHQLMVPQKPLPQAEQVGSGQQAAASKTLQSSNPTINAAFAFFKRQPAA